MGKCCELLADGSGKDLFKAKVREMKGLPVKVSKRTGAKWSEERIATFSAKIKECWKSERAIDKQLLLYNI